MRSTGSWLVYFGKELRLYRERAGLTQTELADRLGWGNGLISKIERAERVPQPEFCAALDTFFDAAGHFTRLGEPVRQHSATARSFVDYLAREGSASAIYTYEPYLVPGLLQTESYARAVIEARRPTVPPEQVQARLAARMTRQDLLDRDDPPMLWAILGEAVLHSQMGSSEVMYEQLTQLLAMAKRPQVTVQMVPFTAGVGPAMGQSFLVAEFPDSPPAFHVDVLELDLAGRDIVEGAAKYKLLFDHLRALALPDDASAEMIATRVDGLRGYD